MDDTGKLFLEIVCLSGMVFWILAIIIRFIIKAVNEKRYKQLKAEVINALGFLNWNIIPYVDTSVIVKSRQALEKYDAVRFFKENQDALFYVEDALEGKKKKLKC